LTFTTSCPLRTTCKHPSASIQGERDLSGLCATWPPTGRRKLHSSDDVTTTHHLEDDDELEESVFEDNDESEDCSRAGQVELRESLGEFSIPYQDLAFGDCVRIGRRAQIYKGRWHGEVMIHTYSDLSEDEVACFWRDVSRLAMIRHENVALFMGACLDPPNLAIVTSVRKGISLFEQIHIRGEKLSMHSRVQIVRQVAQGMGYLHAKGIVMAKLNSKNVYLEPKVKLCLMDYGMAQKNMDRPNKGCIPRGHLTYIAPEMMATLSVQNPRLVSAAPYSNQTDIYAFGTVLYELMRGQYPFHGVHPEVIIYQVASGHHQQLTGLRCSSTLKNLIERCWAREPHDRPEFIHITKDLQINAALHKRHSSSEPERLNRSGLVKNVFT